MIKKWLNKHRWANELLKLLGAGGFALISYSAWSKVSGRGEEASFGLGFFSGMMLTLGVSLIIDVACSIPIVIKQIKVDDNQNPEP